MTCTLEQISLGEVSPNGVAIAGHDRMLFVNSGSNDLLDQYSRSLDALIRAEEMTGHWRHLFYHRQQRCQRLGIHYLQMVIPEKQSIYAGRFPHPIVAPTPLLEGIGAIHTEPWFLHAHEILSAEDKTKPIYRLDDSHLTTQGTEVVARAIADRLGLNIPGPPDLHRVNRPSDLRPCFMDDSLEQCMEAFNLAGIPDPEIVSEVNCGEGHIGRRIVYRCLGAPNQRRVVCFGSSSFEMGRASNQLTWWLSRLCSELHFVWNPRFDFSYLEAVKPEIVIGQTVERFLQIVPDE